MRFLHGVADEDDRVRPGGVDRRLRELLGIRTVHEWWPLDGGERLGVEGAWPGPFHGTLWSEELETTTAEPVARVKGGERTSGPTASV